MPAYLVANFDIVDADAYRDYQTKAGPLLAGGAKILVVDSASTVKEGDGGHQTVVIEYPTRDAAEAAYGSDGYQAAIGIRIGATTNVRVMIVDGFTAPS